MFSFKPIYFVIFALVNELIYAEISDKRLCIDEECSKIISHGKTLIKYNGIEKYMLSFSPNEDVKVFSLEAGSNLELIGVEINGKRGYMNKRNLRETRRLKQPKRLVDTEIVKDKLEVPSKNIVTEINADPTQKSFEIIDGTRIPLEPEFSTTTVPSITQSEIIDQEGTIPLQSALEKENIEIQNQDLVKEKEIIEEKLTESPQNTKEPSERILEQKLDIPGPAAVESNSALSDTEDTVKNNDAVINIALEKTDIESNQIQNTVIPSQNIENLLDKTIALSNNTKFDEIPNEAVNLTEKLENEKVLEVNTVDVPTLINEESEKESVITDSLKETYLKSSSAELTDEKKEIEASSETIAVDLSQSLEQDASVTNKADVSEGDQAAEPNSISEINKNDEANIDINSSGAQKDAEPTILPTENIPELVKDKPEEIIELNTNTETLSIDNGIEASGIEEIKEKGPNEMYVDTTTDNLELTSSFLKPDMLEVLKTDTDDDTDQNSDLGSTTTDIPLDMETPSILENDIVTKNPMELNMGHMSLDGDFTPEFKDIDDSNSLEINQAGIDLSSLYDTERSGRYLNNLPNEQSISISPTENIVDMSKQQVTSNEEEIAPIDNIEISSNENLKTDDDIDKTYEGYKRVFFSNDEDQYCINSSQNAFDMPTSILNTDLFLYLTTSAIAVIILVFGSILFDKCRREGPLIARINKLEQQLLTTIKENYMLQEKVIESDDQKTQLVVDSVPNEVVDELNKKIAEMAIENQALQEQIQAFEKELDNSAEVGIELNKIITQMLNSTDGSEILRENMEQMQKKLLEQQDVINSVNELLSSRETENHELKLELDISNIKVVDLQREVDKLVEKILKLEEEKDQQNSSLEKEIAIHQTLYKEGVVKEETLNQEIQNLNRQLVELQRMVEVKVNEYNTLKLSLKEINLVKNNKDAMKTLLDVTEVKAQLEQVKSENLKYAEQLNRERDINLAYTSEIKSLQQQINEFIEKYEKAVKDKVETNTKLQVLNNYFKEKEDQMQKELSKYESLWAAKEGEATSTTERIKYMQEELQNFKAQNDSLKQEIVNQEVELKSQISMLEKKSHESWVANRQTERKLEEARQEAAQLRNRLTLRERTLVESNNQIRMQSPLQNGDLPVSPPPLDITQSPPPIFNPRDHLTKSPPIPGMPPFLPPPLGANPFMPPPPLEGMMPHFMPPLPPGLFPGDHRPPPLGRMSSPPPVGGRYTPESTVYSEYDRYDRRSPSPIYDSEYGASPPSGRVYSPYDDRRVYLQTDRDYPRSQPRSNGRNSKALHSSGSENDSLGKSNKKGHRKV
ncbi:transport and golgi organization 1 [Rhynchophorus ferrugineus]|uniref:transport and golgi organization 1 n=1 Tax=Rhynchophorus ferrugineus TaxID=354439 RepID=UPI003FCC7AB9